MKCFCKIINGEIPATFAYRSENVVAFDDIAPIAPVHVLIVPVKCITSIAHVEPEDQETLGEMLLAARKIAEDRGIAEDGYRLLIRTGEQGGQEVQQIHMHLIGGAPMIEEIKSQE